MIIGIGHDICDQRRIARLLDRFDQRFVARILTAAEKLEFYGRANQIAYLTGRFAAKEAVYKALSSTNQIDMHWHCAEILSSASGAPTLSLSGTCLEAVTNLVPSGSTPHLHVSISDEPPLSSAFVIFSLLMTMNTGLPNFESNSLTQSNAS